VDVFANTITTAPGELEARYDGFSATAFLSVELKPTCGVAEEPECVLVNGAS